MPSLGSKSPFQTHILGILLGTEAGKNKGTEDGNKYNHYSIMRTVEENWGLTDKAIAHDKDAVSFWPTPTAGEKQPGLLSKAGNAISSTWHNFFGGQNSGYEKVG